MEIAIIVASSLALVFSAITAVFSILAYAKVVGMEKSTHRIISGGMVPLDQAEAGPTGKDLVKKMKRAFYPEEEGHV